MKFWNENEREVFKLTKDFKDPTNPARVPWGKWSDAAVGKVFRAYRKGLPVQHLSGGFWVEEPPCWNPLIAYRIPETVRIFGQLVLGQWEFSQYKERLDSYAITFHTLDDKPVLDKCPLCNTAPIDIKEL